MNLLPFDDHDAPLYSVGQVARMLGVQPAFLRRLDAEEVVQPARSDGGQRRYSRTEVHAVQRVSTLAGEGLALSGIRRILLLEAEVAELRTQLDATRAELARLGAGSTTRAGGDGAAAI
ncbi:MAG: MerR family transcriptional regulator [Acidimicrobiia bacterium]